jgi:hypothetical protein
MASVASTHRPSHMDASTIWVLFMITMVIHVITFHVLEYAADRFRDYLALSALDGTVTVAQPAANKPRQHTPTAKAPHVVSNVAGCHTNVGSTVYYQPLHETLDVSVFT